MRFPAILCIVSLMLLLSSVSNRLIAQEIVFPDSVVMIRDANTDEVGFIFPRLIAIDYRNLVVNVVPLLEEEVELHKKESERYCSLISEHKEEIRILTSNIEDERRKFEEQERITKVYEKLFKNERKLKRRWRLACGAMAVGVLAALIFE